ncbi:Cell division cycle 123 protein [uncultured virus]|nr:Cell division cycle 123 protein [uncultured virus]
MELLGENTCRHDDMSPYRRVGDRLYFPFAFLRMYLDRFTDDNDVIHLDERTEEPFFVLDAASGEVLDKSRGRTGVTQADLYREQVGRFHFENWYDEVPPESTFRSFWIDLAEELVRGLLAGDPGGEVAAFLDAQIASKSVETALPPPYFLRLNSVSPKDASTEPVSTGAQIASILRSSSRTRGTLAEAQFPAKVVLREYVRDMPRHMEFRCFVRGDRLRAISQYDWCSYYPELSEDERLQEDLTERIRRFHEYLLNEDGRFPYEDCVMDVVVLEDRREASVGGFGVFVVEFNTFGGEMIAGSALFNWSRDRTILYESEKATMRVAQKPLCAYDVFSFEEKDATRQPG